MASPVNTQKLVRSFAVHECTSTLAGCTRSKAISFQLSGYCSAEGQEPQFPIELSERPLQIAGNVGSSPLQGQNPKKRSRNCHNEKKEVKKEVTFFLHSSKLWWTVVLAPCTKEWRVGSMTDINHGSATLLSYDREVLKNTKCSWAFFFKTQMRTITSN